MNVGRHIVLCVRWPTGGIRTYLKYFYGPILKEGSWTATLICPPGEGAEQIKADLPSLNFRWKEAPYIGLSMAATLLEALREGRVDVVHSHGLTAGMASVMPALTLRVPHMATLHDVFHDWQLSSLKGRIARAAIEAMLAKVDVVQSVSNDAHENLVRWMPKLKAKKGKAIVIPNGVDASLYSSAAVRDIRQEIELDDDAFLIGFLGRFMGQKGFRVLIRAVEQLVRDDLPRRPVVIAVGGGGFVREDSALISRLGLSSNFRFLPFAPDVASTIRGLNVVAIPSLWEAGPILPMETMMAGTPLIGSSCIGLREVMEGSPAIAVRPGDESALASAIKYVMKNENRERFAMGQYVEIAKARFDVEKSIARLRETLDRLAK